MLKQQQFRSRRATARRAMSVESCEPLRNCTKTHMKRLAIGEWLGKVTQGHLNFRYLIGHTELHRRLIITSLSCTISRILSHLLKSQTDSMRQLKLQAICSFWFMCTHTVVDTVYISQGTGVGTVSNSKSDLRGHSRSMAMVPFKTPHVTSY